jgi:hypothetical protein
MLSKAEIQYLQGQKQVSQSYERKLKCLIRKKVEVLRKEIPLLSKLFVESLELSVESTSLDKKAAPTNTPAKVELNEKDSTQLLHEISATVFSNLEANDVEIDTREVMKSQNSEEILHTIKDKSTPATKFSNVLSDFATKNSNPDEIHQIGLNLVNISGVDAIDHETLASLFKIL